MEAELAAELEDEFDAADSARPPPACPQLLSPAYARARNLHKVLWLSRRLGTRYAGGDAELQSAFDRERGRANAPTDPRWSNTLKQAWLRYGVS